MLVQKFAAEGSNIAVNFVASKERAEEIAEKVRTEYGIKAITLQAVCAFKTSPHLMMPDLRRTLECKPIVIA